MSCKLGGIQSTSLIGNEHLSIMIDYKEGITFDDWYQFILDKKDRYNILNKYQVGDIHKYYLMWRKFDIFTEIDLRDYKNKRNTK